MTKKGGEIFGLDLSAEESLIVPIDEKNCPTQWAEQSYILYKVCRLQLLNTDVAILQTLAVTAQSDVALLVEQTGVVLVVNSVRILVAALGVYVVALASSADVTVNDNLTINCYSDTVALDANLLAVPLAESTPLDTLCRDDTIY
jgi:hypothetical protein